MMYKRMNDVFKINNPNPPANYPRYFDWTAYGIFNALAQRNAPWATAVLDHAQLDEYYAATRGMKIISELSQYVYFDLNVHPAPGQTQLEARNYMLAVTLLTKFGEKWSRLWTLRNIEYSPLENYNMVESGDSQNVKTGSISRGDTGTVTDLHTGTDTVAHSGTDTVTETGTDTIAKSGSETHAYEGGETKTTTVMSDQTDNSIWGFDSASPVPSDRSDRSGLSSEETAYSKTGDTAGKRQDVDTFNNRQDQETKNLSTATQHGETATDTKNLTDTQTRNLTGTETYNNVKDAAGHTLRRSGNIGVTTSQQMAVSEIDLWSAFDYFEIVMKDIDSVLTIGIY